jgi:hypothetical protein
MLNRELIKGEWQRRRRVFSLPVLAEEFSQCGFANRKENYNVRRSLSKVLTLMRRTEERN